MQFMQFKGTLNKCKCKERKKEREIIFGLFHLLLIFEMPAAAFVFIIGLYFIILILKYYIKLKNIIILYYIII